MNSVQRNSVSGDPVCFRIDEARTYTSILVPLDYDRLGLQNRFPILRLACLRFLVCLFSIALFGSFAYGQDSSPKDKDDETKSTEPVQKRESDSAGSLTKYQDMPVPTVDELLKSKPIDWIVLKTQEVIVVEPVSPRPDTLVRINNDFDRYLRARAGFPEGEELLKEKRRQLQKLQLTLFDPGAENEYEYLIDTKAIQKIEYYEDLLLRRANLLIDEGQISIAYDLLMLVDRRNRDNNLQLTEIYETRKREEAAAKTAQNERLRYTLADPAPLKLPKSWPKFDESYQKLLFKDGEVHAERGDDETAMRLFENLWEHNSAYSDLSERLGGVIDRLVRTCVDQSDFRQARYFLNRLATRDASHPIFLKWKEELANQTQAVIAEARLASSQGNAPKAASLIDRAARIWPETPGLRDAHRELIDRHQSVRLGFTRLPGEPTSYPIEPREESEVKAMVLQMLFEPVRVDERGVKYQSAFFESWEPTDLGRQVQFNLRMKRADWESRCVITSADLLEELSTRIDPHRANFDERLAGAIDQISVQSPTQFTIQFRQLPLRLEALLRFPVPLTEGSLALNPDLSPEAISVAGRQRFFEIERDEKHVAYRRVRPQPTTTKARNVDEIVAVRYDSWDRALQGLIRGEISGIPHIGLRDIKGLQDDNRFLVLPYTMPVSHFILFNPRSTATRDGQLRRALSLAIPRDELMNQSVLAGVREPLARVAVTPFPSNGYGHNRLLPEPAYDPQRAAALALTAKKQFGNQLPELRLACPPDPIIRELATGMIEHWRRVGITVVLNDNSANSSVGDWDLAYVATSIVEPLTELWPTLTLDMGCTIESLKLFPERIRHQLLELERSNDWTSAIKQLRRIESELLLEARFIPLWEVDDFFVTRRQLIGLPQRLMHAFQGVERWTLQSWYPQETP